MDVDLGGSLTGGHALDNASIVNGGVGRWHLRFFAFSPEISPRAWPRGRLRFECFTQVASLPISLMRTHTSWGCERSKPRNETRWGVGGASDAGCRMPAAACQGPGPYFL